MAQHQLLHAHEALGGGLSPAGMRLCVHQRQHGAQRDATDGRRRIRCDSPVAEPQLQRHALHRAVALQVRQAERTIVRAAVRGDGVRQLARIEIGDAVRGDALQALRQFGDVYQFAATLEPALRVVQRLPAARIPAEHELVRELEVFVRRRRQRKAVARPFDGRLHERAPGQSAIAMQKRRRARRRRRAWPRCRVRPACAGRRRTRRKPRGRRGRARARADRNQASRRCRRW